MRLLARLNAALSDKGGDAVGGPCPLNRLGRPSLAVGVMPTGLGAIAGVAPPATRPLFGQAASQAHHSGRPRDL